MEDEQKNTKEEDMFDMDEYFTRYMKGSCQGRIYRIEKKIEKMQGEIEELNYQIDEIEEKIDKKQKKKDIYERMLKSGNRKQFHAIQNHLVDIDDSDNEMDYINEVIKIKYDLDCEECNHGENACSCK